MDGALIYRKTRRGAAELTATHGGHVATAARRVLIMLDGRRSLDELAELFGSDSVEHAIAELESQGLARLVDPEAGNSTTQQVLISGGEPELHPLEPELAPLETKPRRRGLAWIALALPALAIAGGYFIVTGSADRPADAPRDGQAAVARPADPVRAAVIPGPDEQAEASANPSSEGPKELPLSGLPPVVVKAAATLAAPGRRTDGQADGPTEPVAPAPEPAPKTVVAANAPAPEPPPSRPREAAPAATKAREAPAPAPVAPVVAETAPIDASRAPGGAAGPPLQIASAAPTPLPALQPVTLHPRKQDPPNFPGRALRARITEGHVLARIWVAPDGKVDQVDIVEATPARIFDDEVRRALIAWTFDPPGQRVSKTVELSFKP